jgi:hypothetical protein
MEGWVPRVFLAIHSLLEFVESTQKPSNLKDKTGFLGRRRGVGSKFFSKIFEMIRNKALGDGLAYP